MVTITDAVSCSDGELRLVSSLGVSEGVREGRVEMCYRGVWGAIYDRNWTAIDAAVTCQQLGFDPKGTICCLLLSIFAQVPKGMSAPSANKMSGITSSLADLID